VQPDPARVAMFALGGTVAMGGRAGPGGVTPTLGAADLVAAVPGLDELGVTAELHDFRQLPGASLEFGDVLALADAIGEVVASGATGVVVTQGTDTIEETSYLLDLVYGGDAPVVVTGAMRNPALAGADGPANLLAAIQVAASSSARGLGCVVVFADEIHAARYVRKTHTTSIAAFRSPDVGPAGRVTEGRVHLSLAVPRRPALRRPPAGVSPRIALVTMALGDDGELLRGIAGRAGGVVVAGFGAGHVPGACVAAVAELAGRMPVILTSRTGAGPVLSSTYGFPGSESDLLARGVISGGALDPFKARVLLYLLVAGGAGRAEITKAFAVAGGSAL
jgi:L-asparaginase